MMKIWNDGIGEMICDYFSNKLKTPIIYKAKHEFEHLYENKIHFIFILDDSGSMYGRKWDNIKSGSL